MTQAAVKSVLPDYDPKQALRLFAEGRHAELCRLFLDTWAVFNQKTFYRIDAETQKTIDTFVLSFLHLFTRAGLAIPEELSIPFVLLNRVISNVVRISCVHDCDAYLEYLRPQPGNYVKILTLYSARNAVQFDRKKIFDLNAIVASHWYTQYASACIGGVISQRVRNNLREHFAFSHPQLGFTREVQELYFGSTYVDGECDCEIKARINERVAGLAAGMPAIVNCPDPRKIAVLSTSWVPSHSVYRILSAYVRALRPRYHVTFFQLGRYEPQDTSLFDEAYVLDVFDKVRLPPQFYDNQFQVAYFPDVGMCLESIVLSTRRIAPIQILGPGHPVSTFGSQMDYFLSGADAENPDRPEENYTERLVLIPGLGAIPNRPPYAPQRRARDTTGPLIINCPGFCQKVNYSYAMVLRRILDDCTRPVRVRFFAGNSSIKCNDHLAFERELHALLGAGRVELFGQLPYDAYMGLMEEGDLTLDTYHFGGGNVISDALFLGVPVVTWQGSRWYNRIGSQMLRVAGLAELVATGEEEYVAIAGRLIREDAFRDEIRRRLSAVDLDQTIYSTADAGYFTKAMDYLIAHHERIRRDASCRVIRIPRD